MIFSVYYLGAMALALADWRGRLARWRVRTPALPAVAWCAILAIAYAAQIAIAFDAAQRWPWPIPLVPVVPEHADAVALAMLATGAVQTCALVGLYRANPSRAIVVIGAAVTIALSLLAPVIVNADVYAYVGNGLLGLAAYAPPAARFPGELALVNARWGAPVPAATYGPLWLAIARGVVSLAPTLGTKVFAFRVLGALSFAALIPLLRACGFPWRLVALVALNPAFAMQFVLDAHNDAIAVAMVVAAAAVARRFQIAASGLIVAAALIKLPYAIAGLPVLAVVAPPLRRYLLAVLTIAAALAISWIVGGHAYVDSLTTYARASRLESVLHVAAMLAALALLGGATLGLRRLRSAVWLIPMLGAYTAPWYVAWSVPYALARRRVLAYLAIWFPVVTAVVEPAFARPWTLFFVVPVLVVTAIL